MNSPAPNLDAESLADSLALAVQELYSAERLHSAQPLVRIDPRVEAAKAPFQFDSARSILHCSGCNEIQATPRSVLYAVWEIGRCDLGHACRKCCPMPNNNQPERLGDLGDILLGLLSLVDQFSSILSQRGQDYRRTERGRSVEQSLSGVLGELSRTQKEGVHLLGSVLDRLLAAVNRQNQAANGTQNGNGTGASQSRKSSPKKERSGRRSQPKANLSLRR